MITVPISFQSDSLLLDGSIYLPDTDLAPRATLVPCSGYQGFNCFYPHLFAEALTRQGFACLGFDYRGFANSEGERGRVVLEEQVRDILHAIEAVKTFDALPDSPLGLLGWGMGASNVLRATAQSSQVGAVAALNGFYDGTRWLKSIMDPEAFSTMLTEVEEDKRHRAQGEASREVPTFHHYPLDPNTRTNVAVELESLHNFGEPVQLRLTESILNLSQDDLLAGLTGTPVYVAHGQNNHLHPSAEATAFFAALSEPKSWYEIAGAHNDFMYKDHDVFHSLMDDVGAFFGTHLCS